MAAQDQKVRSKSPFNKEEVNNVDESNREKIIKIIKRHGLITIDDFGKKASNAAWLLIQHFPREEIEFMKDYLSLMEKNLDKVNKRNYAYLYDRIKTYEKKPQKYGTQAFTDEENKVTQFYKIQNIDKVDEYRAETGLKPLNEYAKELDKITPFSINLPKDYK